LVYNNVTIAFLAYPFIKRNQLKTLASFLEKAEEKVGIDLASSSGERKSDAISPK